MSTSGLTPWSFDAGDLHRLGTASVFEVLQDEDMNKKIVFMLLPIGYFVRVNSNTHVTITMHYPQFEYKKRLYQDVYTILNRI